ncbi:TPA: hypothetical protein J0T04_000304 [Enterococcus faecium]|uniref:hypothetical protein n=1 Tax=Enterococcus faecium TaxID=1352 RepID=UPI0022EBD9B2|nr:hypothetical protein [Enterococcus faecium]HAZ0637581.1 hypothetical protein [Enterococcus faecium]HAZ1080070.1 hypothetical protein [Enterococcus faecium]HCQ8782891.1 hypothetical protein [Enterococcus faecium]HCZ8405394.1 hypothetical protein [Enterococcus faecium]
MNIFYGSPGQALLAAETNSLKYNNTTLKGVWNSLQASITTVDVACEQEPELAVLELQKRLSKMIQELQKQANECLEIEKQIKSVIPKEIFEN